MGERDRFVRTRWLRGLRATLLLGLWSIVSTCGGESTGPLGTVILFTSDSDFDAGVLANVEHATVSGQLRVSAQSGAYGYIWVALSNRGTICKIDTRSGQILGEYRTAPETNSSPNPSRTTVSMDGSVWAGNRGDGSVVHLGLVEAHEFLDRNHNGQIDTSTGYGDVRPWPNAGGEDTNGGVSTAADECILHYVKVSASVVRHVTVNGDGDCWVSGVGGANDRVFDLIDGDSGAVLRTEGPFSAGGYGGLIDGRGILWSATSSWGAVLRWDPSLPTGTGNPTIIDIPNYGLGIGPDGNVWITNVAGGEVRKLRPDGSVLGTFSHGTPNAQGLAVDGRGDVWISSSHLGGTTVNHLRGDGTFVGSVPDILGPTGVAVDASGKIWTTNETAGSATRIDPDGGPIGADGVTRVGAVDLTVNLPGAAPYNYSDMTGSVSLRATSPRGVWRIGHDAGLAGTAWRSISWNTELGGAVPAGTSIAVQARASDSLVDLGITPLMPIDAGAPLSIAGRYIEIVVTLRPAPDGTSPVLSDLVLVGP